MIAKHYSYINDLNVFPVPDGDTGTNMKITTSGAYEEIANFSTDDISVLGRTFSRALLMNARGNSGVIMSQIIKGFVLPFKEKSTVVDIKTLIKCFDTAREISYQAVSNPVEGTILTVIRLIAEDIANKKFESIIELFEHVCKVGKIALDKTPSMLEELRKVGVVDSGGYGLMCFLNGMKDVLNNKVELFDDKATTEKANNLTFVVDDHDNEEGFGYCSEIIMKVGSKIQPSDNKKAFFNLEKYKKDLLALGDSLVCVMDEDIVKVHIHTMTPGKFLNISQKYGEFIKLKFENMTEQFYDRMEKQGIKVMDSKKPVPKKVVLEDKISLILTVPSVKIAKIFKTDYGFEYLVNTNKTGNPSIQELLTKIQKTKTDKVIIITDDTNIVLAATQAADIVKDKIDVRVIKGSNVFHALTAGLEFNPSSSLDFNEKEMTKAVKASCSAVISRSIKDVNYSHISLKKKDYIGIDGKKIFYASKTEYETLKATIDYLFKKSKDPDLLLIIYSGKKNKENCDKIEKYVSETYGLCCEFKEGGQKIYEYFIGIQ